MIQKIILTFKTHFDIGFTDLSEAVLDQYAGGMLEALLTTCEQTAALGDRQFIWTMPAMPLCEMLIRCSDAARPRLEALIGAGRIAWHALPYTVHTDFCALAELRSGFHYARELCARYHRPMPVSAKMSDVPGHGRILPSVLVEQGVRFLHLGSNEFARSPEVPPLFFWQGPDGARVLTMYSEHGYGAAEPPADWPFPVWLSFQHTSDNLGPQTPDGIREIAQKMGERYPGAEIVSGTLDDFYHDLAQYDLSGVPVVTLDLADSWIHGVGSYPAEVALVRECRRRAAALAGVAAEAELMPVYDQLLLFAEHTWGLDVKTWLPEARRVYEKAAFQAVRGDADYRYMERSWDEQRARARTADRLLAALEQAHGVAPREAGDAGPALTAIETGPGLYALSNGRFRLSFGDSGQISAADARTGRVLLKGLSYRYDVYGKDEVDKYLSDYCSVPSKWGEQDNGREGYPDLRHATFEPAFDGWAVEGRVLTLRYRARACAEYGDAERIELRLTLKEAGDELPIELRLFAKQATPCVESGSLVMKLSMADPAYRINKNGDWLDPATDIADGANHALYCLERYVEASENGATVRVEAVDSPLVAIGETGIYTYRRRYERREPTLIFNLFNNQWGTNFPQWIEGDMRFRFVLTVR
ncbi:MAG: DUF5054 domain-containing protein [Christensenellaceae bacterium]|nr:DUF5054 domain-containing protein [Christensenellaceae bacterium]